MRMSEAIVWIDLSLTPAGLLRFDICFGFGEWITQRFGIGRRFG
jgi:hypothetical protein